MASKTKRSKPFDPAKYLDSDEAIAAYIEEARSTGDKNEIARAFDVAERVRAMNSKTSGRST